MPKSAHFIVRKTAFNLAVYRSFKYFLVIAVIVNCVALAFYDYSLHPDLNRNRLISRINYGFTFIYTLEMILRIVVQGLVFHEKAYVRNFWHINDLIVVVSGYIEMIVSPEKNIGLRLIRVIFRPIKLAN